MLEPAAAQLLAHLGPTPKHTMRQAARIAQRAAVFHLGDLVEAGDTKDIFVRPKTIRGSHFVSGRYG